MTIEKTRITGLILAGGRGSRMGGVDKGLQPFRGGAMVAHVITRLAAQVGPLMINANRSIASYQEFGLPVWPDQVSGFAGPLAGIHTGLVHCTTEYLATAPCDSPFLPQDLVRRLSDALVAQSADLAVATTGEAENQQSHPVFCLMKSSLLPHLAEFLQSGGRKIDAWYASLRVVEVSFSDDTAFRNINTLDELSRFE